MSKKLAIKGHSTRGKEVIELLEKLGGHVDDLLDNGTNEKYAYLIVKDENNVIDAFPIDKKDEFDFDAQIFTLEEFLEKYPFKVGDKVIDGYRNKLTIKSMSWSEGFDTMVYDFEDSAIVLAAEDIEFADDNKLSGTVDNSTEAKSCAVSLKAIEDSIDSVQFVQSGKIVAVRFNTQNYENEVELQLDDYEIVVRDGKTYAVLKKPVYPDNYEECVRIAKNIHGYNIYIDTPAYRELLESFVKLLICRDAYWKIAGEEMGLDKPWKPNWTTFEGMPAIFRFRYNIVCDSIKNQHCILVFPTEEMRDAFYENFKDLIEQCKELL